MLHTAKFSRIHFKTTSQLLILPISFVACKIDMIRNLTVYKTKTMCYVTSFSCVFHTKHVLILLCGDCVNSKTNTVDEKYTKGRCHLRYSGLVKIMYKRIGTQRENY
jgi:hypothetical protein